MLRFRISPSYPIAVVVHSFLGCAKRRVTSGTVSWDTNADIKSRVLAVALTRS